MKPHEIHWTRWCWWFHRSSLSAVYDRPVYLHLAGIGPLRWKWYSYERAKDHLFADV